MAEKGIGGQDASPDPTTAAGVSSNAGRRSEPARPAVEERPLLDDVPADERDVGWGEVPAQDDDEHYLREVPPHHGD